MSGENVIIKTEQEVIMEAAEYNSNDEITEEIHLLETVDSGGESTYVEYNTTQEIHSVNEQDQEQYEHQQHDYEQDIEQEQHEHHQEIVHEEVFMEEEPPSVGDGSGGRQRSRQSYSSPRSSTGGTLGGGGNGSITPNNKTTLDEKRMRREIANSNERRRMQSINSGFANLRNHLPRHEGEKMSKAAILQHTASYIFELEQEKARLLNQNSELKRKLSGHRGGNGGGVADGGDIETELITGDALPPVASSTPSYVGGKKRKLPEHMLPTGQTIYDSSDEGRGTMSPEPDKRRSNSANTTVVMLLTKKMNTAIFTSQKLSKELIEVRRQLEKERSLRRMRDEELQAIKRQLYSVAMAPSLIDEQGGGGGSGSGGYVQTEGEVDNIETIDENIIHDDNIEMDDLDTVTYVEIDSTTGQPSIVRCKTGETIDSTADMIVDDVHEEIIESELHEMEMEPINPLAKVYAGGSSPNTAMLPTSKVTIERIADKHSKVKTEKLESSTTAGNGNDFGLRPNGCGLEPIVEAIRHLEGENFNDNGNRQHEQQHQHHQHVTPVSTVVTRHNQESPLALTNKPQQRSTINELRPYLQMNRVTKPVTILARSKDSGVAVRPQTATVYKVATPPMNNSPAIISKANIVQLPSTTVVTRQSRPGVIVAKKPPSATQAS